MSGHIQRWVGILFVGLTTLLSTIAAKESVLIEGTSFDGVKQELDVSRRPALYTGDFADCLAGGSSFNVTKFDAAYYADNSSVLFHLDGTTSIRSESLMLHISVEAYGENRFNMTYDPCKANIRSLCPVQADTPFEAFAVIPIAPSHVAGIPSIALNIPDLEGFSRIQLFANSTQTQIGCFQAVMTNGQSFSQPWSVGTILGCFILIAMLASFATSVYGLSITAMRTHYAHSFSILVIFETLQTIFFSGALSVDWPSVLPAWWSNFAWTAGMFANDNILRSLASFMGNSGNTSPVGEAGSVTFQPSGGLLKEIYGHMWSGEAALERPLHSFARRTPYNASNPYDYTWHGYPTTPGMPMPGTWPGFGGTLSMVNVPSSEAFTIGLIWLLVMLAAVAVFIVVIKLALESLARLKRLKTDGFDYFRSHWRGYLIVALLRSLYVAFFPIMTLTMYQFSMQGAGGPTIVAAIVWFIFFLGSGGVVAYACYLRLQLGTYNICRDTIRFESGKLFDTVPFIAATRASQIEDEEATHAPYLFVALPFFQVKFTHTDPDRTTFHHDEAYIKRFGWLSGRYRRTRWWFFAVYMSYQFLRACFIGGAAQTPLAQVFGLFLVDALALPVMVKLNSFEGSRNMVITVWMLSISKIVTTGLSIAFLPIFVINRIVATILGIIIVITQGFLILAVLVLIVLGVISTWMSLSRNREDFPSTFEQTRIAYFEHLEACASDIPPPPTVRDVPPIPITPYFNVREVRRTSKIEDEEDLNDYGIGQDRAGNATAMSRRSRPDSAASWYSTGSLPRAARVHRASWSMRDPAQWASDLSRPESQRMRSGSLRTPTPRPQSDYEAIFGYTPSPRPLTPTRELLE